MTLDTAKTSAFEQQLVNSLNAGAVCLMTSIGHRTGLFDTMTDVPGSTPAEIAQRAGLNERYVREWLGAMTVGAVVEHEPQTNSYTLPPEHAGMLTRDAGADNFAVFAQYIGQLGCVETDIVDCFRNGGGVSYDKFDRFHEIMAEDSGQSVLPALADHILPLVPGIKGRLESGIEVLDVGCGRGRALQLLAQTYPNSTFTGYDLSDEAINYARMAATAADLNNLHFEVRDLSDFDVTAPATTFDFITTFDAIHDQARPLRVLTGIARALKGDGIYLMQDIDASTHHHKNLDHPLGPLLYTISCMHCMTVSLAQGGDGLGAMWGEEQATDLLSAAGFRQTDIHRLEHDIQNAYYVSRK